MEIYKKLAKAISELPAMKKDTKGYNYKYFDINQILEKIKPVFEKHGLYILQPLTNVDGKPAIKTVIVDTESGEKIEETFPFLDNSDPQKQGSTITYYRRYALQSFLGLESEDDDGKKGGEKSKLTPASDKWETALEAVKSGKWTVEQIRSKYTLSDTDAKLLTQ